MKTDTETRRHGDTEITSPRLRVSASLLALLISFKSFAAGTPEYGDVYVDASIGDASMLNPVLSSDSASNDINGQVFNGLVKYDKNIKLVGELVNMPVESTARTNNDCFLFSHNQNKPEQKKLRPE